MPKKSLEPYALRYELYPGLRGMPRFGGVVTEGHPGQIPANRFRRLRDTRFYPEGPGVRPGERDVTGADGSYQSDTHCIRNLYQFDCDPLRLWLSTFGCPGVGGTTGGALITYDQEQEPQWQLFATYKSVNDRDPVIGVWGDKLLLGDGSNLKEIVIANTIYGLTADEIDSTPPDVFIKSFPGYQITAIAQKFGVAFIALLNTVTPANSKIVVYDGVSVEDDLLGIDPVTCLYGDWREHLVAGFTAATNEIQIRDENGTWTAVPPAAGTVATWGPVAMASAWDDLFIADGTNQVWRYDGAALAVALTVVGAGSPPATIIGGVVSLEFFGDYLEYAWNKADGSGAFLGTFDDSGSSIEQIDQVKAFTVQFSNLKYIYGIKKFRNVLLATFYGNVSIAADYARTLISSPGFNLEGTWDGDNPGTTSATGRPFNLIVH